LSSAVPRHRGPCPLIVLTDLRAFLVRQVRCLNLVLPPDRTRCSPGLRFPPGFSPLAQPAGEVPEQDPLAPGCDHRWCPRVCADLTRSSSWRWQDFFEHRTRLLRLRARFPYRHHRSDLPWAFLLHPPARERTKGHASRPSEDHTVTIGGVYPIFWVSEHPRSPLSRQISDAQSPCLAVIRKAAAVARACSTSLVLLQASGEVEEGRIFAPKRLDPPISLFLCLRSESAHITSLPANVANPR